MSEYCVRKLGLSEPAAYLRITAARCCRRFPVVLEMLEDGRLHLSAVARLTKWLTPGNANDLLSAATGKTKAEVIQLIAERFPQRDVRTVVHEITGGVVTPVDVMQRGTSRRPETVVAETQLCPDRVDAEPDQLVRTEWRSHNPLPSLHMSIRM